MAFLGELVGASTGGGTRRSDNASRALEFLI